jgi:lysophospholipase
MERKGIVTGLDMTTEAAYTKLAYLLALPGITQAEVAENMRHNLRGELTADFREEQKIKDSAQTTVA